jgi:hypothetical protein
MLGIKMDKVPALRKVECVFQAIVSTDFTAS